MEETKNRGQEKAVQGEEIQGKEAQEEAGREPMRYAFFIDLPDADPKTCSAVCQNGESCCVAVGVDGMEMGKHLATELFEQGFRAIDLCSTFPKEMAVELRELLGEQARIRQVTYTLDGFIKLDFTRKFRKCGIIIAASDVAHPLEMLLRNEKRDIHVAFVGNIRQAKSAAQKMVTKQVDYIELSYWFDRMRLDSVVRAVGGKVAVGTCGDLRMRELVDDPQDEPLRVAADIGKRKKG